jgi:hypothetical protein
MSQVNSAMKIKSIKLTKENLPKLKSKLGYLNIPLDSIYDLQNFLSTTEHGICQLDSLSRIILKIDGCYLEGDEYRVDELFFNATDKIKLLKRSKKSAFAFCAGLIGVGTLALHTSTSPHKYPTVDICFKPQILHSTPKEQFCKNGDTIYRTSPDFLLEKGESKPNPEFVEDSDKFKIPAKGRVTKNWNRANNPHYLWYAAGALGLTGLAYCLHAAASRRFAIDFPEFFAELKAYTKKRQESGLATQSLNSSLIAARTGFLNNALISDSQSLELGFQSTPESLAAKQQAMFEAQQAASFKQSTVEDRLFQLDLARLDKEIAENKRDAHKAITETQDTGKGDKKAKKEELDKTRNEIIKAFEAFGISLTPGEEPSIAPSIIRHKFKFDKTKESKLKKLADVTKLAEDLALALSLPHTPRICRDKGEIIIEIPREDREFPSIHDAIKEIKKPTDKESLLVLGGVNTDGKMFLADVVNGVDKHIIGAGATGSGKTQGLYAQIAAIVSMYTPDEVKFAIYDGKSSLILPKQLEPWLFSPTAFATEGKDFIEAIEVERVRRMNLRSGFRDIQEYNAQAQEKLPYIFVLFDEYSVDREYFEGESADENIAKKLTKLSRSEGIHLYIVDQAAKNENISNRVKENAGARWIFKMVDEKCSDYVGVSGAETLLGKGDVIVKWEGVEYRCQMPNCSPKDLEQIVVDRIKELTL